MNSPGAQLWVGSLERELKTRTAQGKGEGLGYRKQPSNTGQRVSELRAAQHASGVQTGLLVALRAQDGGLDIHPTTTTQRGCMAGMWEMR